MTKKQAIKRAEQINAMLTKLQLKVQDLVIEMNEEDMDYFPHMFQLIETLHDLSSFDLEDSIQNAKDYE